MNTRLYFPSVVSLQPWFGPIGWVYDYSLPRHTQWDQCMISQLLYVVQWLESRCRPKSTSCFCVWCMHGSVLYTSVIHCSAEPGAGGVDCIINKKCLCKGICFCKKVCFEKKKTHTTERQCQVAVCHFWKIMRKVNQASKFLHKSFYILYVYW